MTDVGENVEKLEYSYNRFSAFWLRSSVEYLYIAGRGCRMFVIVEKHCVSSSKI